MQKCLCIVLSMQHVVGIEKGTIGVISTLESAVCQLLEGSLPEEGL